MLRAVNHYSRLLEYRLEHFPSQPSSKRVLLTGVIRSNKRHRIEKMDTSVPKPRRRSRHGQRQCATSRQIGGKRNLSQSNDDSDFVQQSEFLEEIRSTGKKFFEQWLII